MRAVDRAAWLDELAALRGSGLSILDLLTAVDRGEQLEIVARVVDPRSAAAALVSTRVPAADAALPTATFLYPAAGWHERETAEMFGVAFLGHPDPRPLLLRSAPAHPPLRKAAPLAERVSTPWPGADPGGRARRRQLPPGVQESWLEDGDG